MTVIGDLILIPAWIPTPLITSPTFRTPALIALTVNTSAAIDPVKLAIDELSDDSALSGMLLITELIEV